MCMEFAAIVPQSPVILYSAPDCKRPDNSESSQLTQTLGKLSMTSLGVTVAMSFQDQDLPTMTDLGHDVTRRDNLPLRRRLRARGLLIVDRGRLTSQADPIVI